VAGPRWEYTHSMRRRVPVPKLPLMCSTLMLACAGPPAAAPASAPGPTPAVADTAGGTSAAACDATELGEVALGALGDTPGAVVVIDLQTGDELVAVSNADRLDTPTPPASTVKAFLAHAALEGGVVTPSESLPCNGAWTNDGRTLTCFHDHAQLDLAAAVATSCNAYFYEAVHRLGTDRVATTFETFGLTRLSKTLREAPEAERMAIAVGHGSGLVTPRELASAFAGLVTSPSEAHEFVHAGMVDAVSAGHGTARDAATKNIAIAGKTGTAGAGEDNHAWFAGYAPAAAPRVLALAYLQGDGTGGSLAAPVAAKVLSTWSSTCR